MTFIPVGAARVPFSLNQLLTLNAIQTRQQALTRVGAQLSSGQRLALPSDDPSAAVQIAVFKELQARNEQFLASAQFGGRALAASETALNSFLDAVNTVTPIGLRNNSTLQAPGEREVDAEQIDQIIDNLVNVANQKYLDRFMFAGHQLDAAPFTRDGNFVQFNGDNGVLSALSGLDTTFDLNVTANGTIGVDSVAGQGIVDLNPSVTASTRLNELNGGRGVARGSIAVSVGGPSAIIDLSDADTVGDVLSRINSALGAGSAVIAPSGSGIRLVGAGPIAVSDVNGGATGRDLGLLTSGAASPFNGGDLNPTIGPTTLVSALALGGPLGTLSITNGPYSANVDLSTATTVEDILNRINGAGARVRAEINSDRTGINVVNVLAGSGFTVTGTAAQTLGVATTNLQTSLADFNDGGGVSLGLGGGAALSITTRDGASHQIDFNDPSFTDRTVGGLLAFIASSTGGDVTGAVNANGAIALQDNTGGSTSNFVITGANGATTATDLGIDTTPAGVASSSFVGSARHQGRVQGIFDTLLQLRDGLVNGDLAAIQIASTRLQRDSTRLTSAVAAMGGRMQTLDQATASLTDTITQLKADTSQIAEPDLSQTLTDLATQQTALQAALASTGRLLQQSLLDYL